MTCEWAEGFLSAYLDDALDPQLRKDVGAHIEQCARCQALTEEYRRNDQLLSTLAPVEPSDHLRQRIFESHAFAALSSELERETRTTADAPPGRGTPRRAPLYVRALVPLAALLTLSLGAALLFKQGLLPGAQTASQNQTNTIGGPSAFDLPLSAGPRLVYLHGDALWSVAEYAPNDSAGGPGAPQRLTANGVRVIAWRVAPLAGAHGGARIAYVDGMTGALHIVHSDGQADTIVGSLSPTQSPSDALWSSQAGRAALASLSWSPDGSRLAYVTTTATGGSQARVVALSGSSAAIAPAMDGGAAQLTWSADGHALAFATMNGGVSTVVVWRGAGQSLVTSPADPSDTGAPVAQIAWSGSTLTWSTSRGGAIVGVYALPTHHAGATALTPAGASYSAAAFTPARGGMWLLAGDGALSEARLAGGVAQVATMGARASAIAWSPDGTQAALALDNRLALWSANSGLTTLTQGAVSQIAWSPTGGSLAVAQGQNVLIYNIGGSATQVTRLANTSDTATLAWATDERNIAVAGTHGMILAPTNGAGATLLTSHPAEGGALSWSVAG